MSSRYIRISAVVLACACAAWCRGDDFEIRLGLKNAHLREVFFGCKAGATAGYDRRVDDFAPPPGIQTGYVGFISGVKGLPLFYKDIHGTESEQTWKFYTRVYEGKPMTISWDASTFPEGWTFAAKTKTGTLDMRKVQTLELKESQTVVITGVKKAGDTPKKQPEGKKPQKQK